MKRQLFDQLMTTKDDIIVDPLLRCQCVVLDESLADDIVEIEHQLGSANIELPPSGNGNMSIHGFDFAWIADLPDLYPPYDCWFVEFPNGNAAGKALGTLYQAYDLYDEDQFEDFVLLCSGLRDEPIDTPDEVYDVEKIRWLYTVILYQTPYYKNFTCELGLSYIAVDEAGNLVKTKDGGLFYYSLHPVILNLIERGDIIATGIMAGGNMYSKEIATLGIGLAMALPLKTLSIWNCRNVSLKEVEPKESDIKKSMKRWDAPVTSHHVLVFKSGKLKDEPATPRRTKAERQFHRWHTVKAHFKTYTEDAPLFGRIVGTVYVPSHARGNPDFGAVTKDYEHRKGAND